MTTILYIEPHFTTLSPSMKSVVRAFPSVAEEFDKIEVWSVECEVEHPKLDWQRLWAPKIWPLRLIWCVLAFHLRALWRFGVLRQKKPDVIQTTDFYAVFANIIYVHFHFARYQQIIASNPGVIVSSYLRKILKACSRLFERACFFYAKPKIWLTVSESMAFRLEKDEKLHPLLVLPNAYDDKRFNPSVRLENRQSIRLELGILPDDIILGFSALGDFERKGLPLLFAAAKGLRDAGKKVKVLLVGPSIEQISKNRFLAENPSFLDHVIVTGRVTNTERYFSAMDAFVFPSHCESFCLVLMETAAMGIPVFPSAFDGHEMTLIEGVNGALIPWDAVGIEKVITNSWHLLQIQSSSYSLAKGVTDEVFKKMLLQIYQKVVTDSNNV